MPRLAGPALGLLVMLGLSTVGAAACAAPGTTPAPAGSGVGMPTGTPATGTPPVGAPSSTAPPTGAPPTGCAQGVRTGEVMLTESDGGTTACVAAGTSVDVVLHARAGQQWSKPVSDGAALRPTASGKGALQVGVSASFYVAAAPGQARVTAQLSPCRGPKPGPACDAVQLYTVLVVVVR